MPWCYVNEFEWAECNVPLCSDCSCAEYGVGSCEYVISDIVKSKVKHICKCDAEATLHSGVCLITPPEGGGDDCQPGDNCGLGKCKYSKEKSSIDSQYIEPMLSCQCDEGTIFDVDERCKEIPPTQPEMETTTAKVTPSPSANTTPTTLSPTTPEFHPAPSPSTEFPLPAQPGGCWYNGTRAYTRSGKICERWDSDVVKYTETIIKRLFQRHGVTFDHNYCRFVKPLLFPVGEKY